MISLYCFNSTAHKSVNLYAARLSALTLGFFVSNEILFNTTFLSYAKNEKHANHDLRDLRDWNDLQLVWTRC